MTDNPTLIVQSCQRHGVIPKVGLALAAGEGGLGTPASDRDVGYGYGPGVPTSFGPFQLHWKGACPQRLWGDVAASRAWCNSADGIDYAVGLFAAVGGDHPDYRVALTNAVERFERPARPGPEVARDIAWYESHPDPHIGPPPPPAFPAFPGVIGPHQGDPASIQLAKVEALAKQGFLSDRDLTHWTPKTTTAVHAAKQSHDAFLYWGSVPLTSGRYFGHYQQIDPTHWRITYSDDIDQPLWDFLRFLAVIHHAG